MQFTQDFTHYHSYYLVYSLLEDTIYVTIANPKWVKAVKGNKDDTKDSKRFKWINEIFRLVLVHGRYMLDKSIRILRGYTNFYAKWLSINSEKNRFKTLFLFAM